VGAASARLAALAPIEIKPGLWRWSAPHPDWKPSPPGSGGDWPRDVGCVLYEIAAAAVLIDPLAQAGDAPFWEWADARCAGRDVVVLLTIGFHERSGELFRARYGAAAAAPAGVEALAFPELDETMYWLPAARTLVPGDRLIGAGEGGLSLCPPSWLRYIDPPPTLAQMREQLRALLDLDAEAVLVSHGEPVLTAGREAIARALEAEPGAEPA
jgi:hypothetical protein